MNLHRLGTIVGIELRQRVRSIAWYVLLGVFALILLGLLLLSFASFALWNGGNELFFSIVIMLVLLLVLLVSPTLSGSAVNGDRDAATLAPVQVTLVTTGEIVIGKFLAAWISGLAFLVVAAPFLLVATFAGGLNPLVILTSLVILVVEVGVVAAIGVGLSAVVARPLFSVASTYLIVAALTIGTLLVFGLGGTALRTSQEVVSRDFDFAAVPSGAIRSRRRRRTGARHRVRSGASTRRATPRSPASTGSGGCWRPIRSSSSPMPRRPRTIPSTADRAISSRRSPTGCAWRRSRRSRVSSATRARRTRRSGCPTTRPPNSRSRAPRRVGSWACSCSSSLRAG